MSNITNIADQMIIEASVQKFAAENSALFQELNKKFNEYIKRDFKSIELKKSVPYEALSVKEKEFVWNTFWKSPEVLKIFENKMLQEEKAENKI